MPKPQTLVIALDAANGDLIRRWSEEGMLPNIADLMARGRSATVSGVTGFFTGSTWPSLLTSTTPAVHGIHYLAQIRPGSYEFYRPHEEEYIRAPMFWSSLGQQGKRLAILDVPLSKLDSTIEGIQTVEWAGHDAIFGFQTSPPELAAHIRQEHGRHPVRSDCDAVDHSPEGLKEFVESLVDGVRKKGRLTMELLAREEWDLFMQVFTESHCVGHQCWHLHDTAHPTYDPEVARGIPDPVLRVYQAIDSAIGEMISKATPETTIYLTMPHGMSHSIGAQLLLPQILAKIGVTTYKQPVPKRLGPREIVAAIERRLPSGVRKGLDRARDRLSKPGSFGLPGLNIVTGASKCFIVPNGLQVSGIRFNLAGREPGGMVKPGDEADELSRQISEELLQIRLMPSDEPIVHRVIRTSDLYSGPCLDHLPDLLIEWNNEQPIGTTAVAPGRHATISARSPSIGTLEAVHSYGRTGEHRANGLIIAAGPGIEPGDNVQPVSILDIAPTITASLGVPMPGAEGSAVGALVPDS